MEGIKFIASVMVKDKAETDLWVRRAKIFGVNVSIGDIYLWAAQVAGNPIEQMGGNVSIDVVTD